MKKILQFYSITISILFIYVSQTNAQDIEKLAEAFGSLPELNNIELSPDGKKLLMLQNVNGQIILVTRSLEDFSAPLNGFPFDKGQYAWATWISNTEIIAGLSYTGKSKGGEFFRNAFGMVLVDWEGESANLIADPNIKHYDRLPLYDLRIVDILEDDPDHILIQIVGEGNRQRGWKRDVYKRNIRTQKMEIYHRGIRSVKRWIADKDHNIRLGSGLTNALAYRERRDVAHYRKNMKRPWIELYDYIIKFGLGYEKEGADEKPFNVEGFSANPSILYVSAKNDYERNALYLYDVDRKEFVEEVASNEHYDLRRFRFDDDYNFESYTIDGEKTEVIRIGERGNRLSNIFERSFADSLVTIVHETKDKKKMVIRVSSPLDPGTFYFFDDEMKKLEMLGYNYQKVDVESLSGMSPVSYKARDGLDIPSYLTIPKGTDGKKMPTIIMPHGGPLARDTLRFDYWVQFLASQGYAVLQMNFRGSTGYGEEFMKKGFHEWGRKMLEDINDGAKWVIEQGIADPNRMCIAGWSYGGYAALQAIVKDQSLYKCSVAMAPVTDLDKEFQYWMTTYIESKEWTYDEASPADNIDKINVPVLLLQGDVDASVDVKHTRSFNRKMERAGKDIKYIEFENESHYLRNQAYRIRFLNEIGHFLEKHLK